VLEHWFDVLDLDPDFDLDLDLDVDEAGIDGN
jgi:hypothetical protein